MPARFASRGALLAASASCVLLVGGCGGGGSSDAGSPVPEPLPEMDRGAPETP